jgi:ribose 1,5-bisphosphokinase
MKSIQGQLIFLVGNSGSGKDSLLKAALENWPEDIPEVRIPRRYITRPPHETEPFYSVSEEEFHKLDNQGKFCLTWHIYDLYYGVPKEILDWIDQGALVVVNVSRSIISEAKMKYPNLKVIFVKVPFEVTLQRIKSRGRESEDDPVFQKRVERARKNQDFPTADFIVDNAGDLLIGASKLREYLLSLTK